MRKYVSFLVRASILLFLTFIFTKAKAASSTLYIQGRVNPIVTVSVTKLTPTAYIATVTSNNPNGYHLHATNGLQVIDISVPFQTEALTTQHKLNFTSVGSDVKIEVLGD